jgi:hypothetical protein
MHPTTMGKQVDKEGLAETLDTRASDEARALGYLQRLNVTGYDVKGQLSSAYAQSGVGLSLGAKVDFGAMLVPFVHLDLGVDVQGERTAHSILVLQRMPHRVWMNDMVRPPQPAKNDLQAKPPAFPTPYWRTKRPLALALLQGKTWQLKAGASAAAWAGLGSLGDYDETGLTLGVKLQGRASGVTTRLVDVAPRHYPPTPSDSTLNEDVDDLFDSNLKNKAAAWLLETGGGIDQLRELGAPRTPLLERAELDAVGTLIEAPIVSMLGAYDKLTIPDVDNVAIVETGFSVVRAMAHAATAIKGLVSNKNIDTDKLLAQLNAVKAELEAWAEYLRHSRQSSVFGGETRRRLWEIARHRLAEAKDFIAALERRRDRKAQRKSKPARRPPAEETLPPFHLDILVVEGSGDATAGGKVVLMNEAGAHVEAGASGGARRISLRYQGFAPGGEGDRRLLCSQQTVINYVSRKMTFEASAGKRKFLRERPNLVTMSYRSVIVNWFDDLKPENHRGIPNGTGVSFGMSVLAESFGEYARACKQLKETSTPLSEKVAVLESAMTKQLRVTAEELRAFMRNAPSSMGNVKADPDAEARVESYLVESAFAFTAPVDLTKNIDNHRPKALFELDAVKNLVEKAGRGADLRLQVVRLRYRIRTDDDQSRNLIRLGWNPEPGNEEGFDTPPFLKGDDGAGDPWYVRLFGVDPTLPNWLKWSSLALELGIGVERVRRVGSEGIADLYQWLYPHPYNRRPPPEGYGRDRAQELEAKTHKAITDMLVPPVTLFSH